MIRENFFALYTFIQKTEIMKNELNSKLIKLEKELRKERKQEITETKAEINEEKRKTEIKV